MSTLMDPYSFISIYIYRSTALGVYPYTYSSLLPHIYLYLRIFTAPPLFNASESALLDVHSCLRSELEWPAAPCERLGEFICSRTPPVGSLKLRVVWVKPLGDRARVDFLSYGCASACGWLAVLLALRGWFSSFACHISYFVFISFIWIEKNIYLIHYIIRNQTSYLFLSTVRKYK